MGTSSKVFSGVASKLGQATTGGANRQVQPDTSAVPTPKSKADSEKAKQRLQEIRDSQITYTQKLENAGQDTLQIGDLIFGMPNTKDGALTPPIAINTAKQAINYKWQTLRTDTSVKVASGKSNARISFSLYFVGMSAINSGLRRLIATFNSLPFVYVENSFIRANLAPDNWGNMACSLVGLNIRTEQGLTNVLVADLDLLWFNYKPYANNFWFRQRWDSVLELKETAPDVYGSLATMAEGVKHKSPSESELSNPTKEDPTIAFSSPAIQPLESKPLLDHVSRKEGPLMDELSNAIIFKFKEYRSISGYDLSKIVTPGRINPSYLRSVSPNHIRAAIGSSPVFMLHPVAAQALEELAADYFHKTGKIGKSQELVISSCYRTREMQLAHYLKNPANASKPGNSWHQAGLAVDIPVTGHRSKNHYEIFLSLAREKGFKPIIDQNKVRWNTDGTSPYNQSNSPPSEAWHFNFARLQSRFKGEYPGKDADGCLQAIKKLILLINYSNVTSEATGETLKEEEQEKRNEEYEGAISAKIGELTKDGFELDVPTGTAARVRSSSSTRLVFSRPKTFRIFKHDPELVPQGISIAKHNIIPQIPIASHEYATQQYLGSTDMDAVITFSSVSEERLKLLQRVIAMLQQNSRADREIRDSAVLDIDNSLFNFVGFDRALVDGISSRSVPGSPGLYDVTLQLTQYKIPKPQFKHEKVLPCSAWLFIAKHVYSNLISLNSSNISAYLRASSSLAEYLAVREVSGGLKQRLPPTASTADLPDPNEPGISPRERAKRIKAIKNPPREPARTTGQAGLYESKEQFMRKRGVRMEMPEAILNLFTPTAQRFIKKEWGNINRIEVRETSTGVFMPVVSDDSFAGLLVRYAIALMKALERNLHPDYAIQLGMESKIQWINMLEQSAWLSSLIPDRFLKIVPDKEDAALLEELRSLLKRLGNTIIHEEFYRYDLFAQISNEIGQYLSEATPGSECYPDLDLPPHKLTGDKKDTPPDYWFYNEPIDGGLLFTYNSQEALEEAKQVMKTSYEYVDKVMSPKEWKDRQISFNKPEIFSKTATPLAKGGTATAKMAAAALNIDEAGMAKAKKQDYDKATMKSVLAPEATKKGDNVRYARNRVDYAHLPDKISFGKRTKSKNEIDSDPAIMSETVTGKDSRKLEEIFEQAFANFNKNVLSLSRAYPTFKIYFMEEDSGDYVLNNMRNFDDFYSYSAIKDIRIVRSRKIPADLCVISITNIHGELDTLAYRSGDDPLSSEHVVEKFDPATVDTTAENPFSKLVVVEGSKIQMRLGYSNNPDELEILFNGQVVEVGQSPVCPDIIQLVCQSYAVELTADKKYEGKYDTTQELLSAMMCSSEVQHFGRWSSNGVYDPRSIRTGRDGSIQPGLLGIWSLLRWGHDAKLGIWNFQNDPRDDNIFAPADSAYSETTQKVADWTNYFGLKSAGEFLDMIDDEREYYPRNGVTIWDIFKEMELRHPGFIASPVPYGNRYTMFFGAPNDLYWSRPMSILEERGWKPILQIDRALAFAHQFKTLKYKGESYKHREAWHHLIAQGGPQSHPMQIVSRWLGSRLAKQYHDQTVWLIKKRMQRFKPFRNYHFLSSQYNIIANNIYASAHGTYNAIDLLYLKDVTPVDRGKETTIKESAGSHFTMKVDDNIEDKDTRLLETADLSCFGSFYATRHAVSLLMQSLKDIYKGEITITGDPSIKPYDVLWIADDYRDIYGMVEVEQVTHIFSHETGFITEIKPDLILSHNATTTQCTLEAMWEVGSNFFKSVAQKGPLQSTALTAALAGGALLVGKIGMILAMLGGYRMMTWSQARQPIFFTPLIQNGKPLIAGLHGYKYDTLWVNLKGKLKKFKGEMDEGWSVLTESSLVGDYFRKMFAN